MDYNFDLVNENTVMATEDNRIWDVDFNLVSMEDMAEDTEYVIF